MSVSFSAKITGTDALQVRIEGMAARSHDAMVSAIDAEMELLRGAALDRMDELFRNAGGKMRDAMQIDVLDGGEIIEGSLTASGLPYLAIQEYGGITSPHDIFPVNAQVLAFFGTSAINFTPEGGATGPLVFAKAVHHPGSRMPERSYERAALARRRAAILDAIKGAVDEGAAAP